MESTNYLTNVVMNKLKCRIKKDIWHI